MIFYIVMAFITAIIGTSIYIYVEIPEDFSEYIGGAVVGVVAGIFWPLTLTGLVIILAAKGIVHWLDRSNIL